eukprot:6487235-Amphidinium_carterae.1
MTCAPTRGELTAKGSSKTDGRTIFTKIEPKMEAGSCGKDGKTIFTGTVRSASEQLAERRSADTDFNERRLILFGCS